MLSIILLLLILQYTQVQSFQLAAYMGIFDDAYNASINSQIPWKMFDKLVISFANIDKYGNLTNENPLDHTKIMNVIKLYKRARPDGIITISLYDEREDRFVYAANHPENFYHSVKQYMNKYNLDGLDVDFESVGINGYKTELISMLKSCYNKSIHNDKNNHKNNNKNSKKIILSHTIWPYVHYPETVGALNDVVDYANIMSYSQSVESIEVLINAYNKSGFEYGKMVLGIETESDSETYESIKGKMDLIRKYNMAGLFVWRLDNDGIINNKPTYKTIKLLQDVISFRIK